MSIPSEIATIVGQLNLEFLEIEREATECLNLVRRNLSLFPNNIVLTQLFAYLNTVLFSVETQRAQVRSLIEILDAPDVSSTVIIEAGEDLGTLLGRVIETKIAVRKIAERLKE